MKTIRYEVILAVTVAVGTMLRVASPVAAEEKPPPGIAKGEEVEVGALVEQVTRDPRGWLWALQDAVDQGIELDAQDYLRQLEEALAEVQAGHRQSRRAIVLVRLARVRSVKQAHLPLADALHLETISEDLRYEMARSLASLVTEPAEILSLLKEESDAVLAGVIDAVGVRKDKVIRRRLGRLLAEREKYQATRTGDALTQLQLLKEYESFWETHSGAEERIGFLLKRAGEMYLPVPSPSPPVRSDSFVASWLRERFAGMFREKPDLMKSKIEAYLESAPANATILSLALDEIGSS